MQLADVRTGTARFISGVHVPLWLDLVVSEYVLWLP